MKMKFNNEKQTTDMKNENIYNYWPYDSDECVPYNYTNWPFKEKSQLERILDKFEQIADKLLELLNDE